ncbi:hypothetical protein JV173_00680 [Acholeplasma equirhinis]|uniref:hypothetical protein n=1 Tax=Acholeplasma equirhinis TaxID=555393 RepID=UPI00197A778F|nr:hypothetical protein [Acholeplasma equirhinis]MBN3490019.1 hypothetical protein [Acholeplasma equirhinis]
MKKNKILNKVYKNKMNIEQAYSELYEPKPIKYPKAHFVKVRVYIEGKRGINMLLAILLALPIPIWIVKKILDRKMKTTEGLDQTQLNELQSLIEVRGISLGVSDQNTHFTVKTI